MERAPPPEPPAPAAPATPDPTPVVLGPPTCADLVRRAVDCTPSLANLQDKAVQDCVVEADDPGHDELLACARSETCEAFLHCGNAVDAKYQQAREARRVARKVDALEQQLTSGHWRDAYDDCDTLRELAEKHAPMKAVCAKTVRAGHAALTTSVTKMRDQLSAEDTFNVCEDLQELAAQVNAASLGAAMQLCAEVALIGRVKAAKSAVVRAIKAGSGPIPDECEWAVKDLQKVKGAWANRQLLEIKAACYQELPKRAATGLTGRLTALRDSGGPVTGAPCRNLKPILAQLDAPKAAALKELCAEVAVLSTLAKATQDAAAAIAQSVPRVPVRCASALQRLDKVGSVWAKSKAAELAGKCYSELGVIVLEEHVPKMKFVCAYQAKKVFQGVRKYALSSPRLDELMKSAAPLCDK